MQRIVAKVNKSNFTETCIKTWLSERQAVLVKYCKLAPPKSEHSRLINYKLPSLESLNIFFQDLIDYLSHGHFRIFPHILDAVSTDPKESQQRINKLIGDIMITTEVLIGICDQYKSVQKEDELILLQQDLSRLGELLDIRLNLEDEIFRTLYRLHSAAQETTD